MKKNKKPKLEPLDYHEGLSINQVKVILNEFGFGKDYKKFFDWMAGQTCPLILKWRNGSSVEVQGVYEYDLFRWIEAQKKRIPLIWD